MASTLPIDSTLSRDPKICGGRLCIDGTRFTLNQVVTLYKRGESAEGIATQYSHLALVQIYGALTYYHAHRDEVDADLAAEEAEAVRLERSQPSTSGRP